MDSSDSYASEAPAKVGSVEVDSCVYELYSKSGSLNATLASCNSDSSSLTVPATVESDGNTYGVVGIAPRALRQTHIESIDFASDSQVKSLGKDALYCHTLKKCVLPSSLEALTTGWCNFTLKLVDLTVADGNEHFVVHEGALYNSDKSVLYHVARNTKQFVVPATVKTIGGYAFEQCRRLRSIDFEDDSQLINIEPWAFSHCGLKEVCFPDSLETIGYDAFFHTPRLEEIVFGTDSVLKHVLIGAFKDTSLSDVTLPPTTVKLGIAAFQNCPKLEKITILNNGTITIWRDAFTGTNDSFKLVVTEETKLKGAGVPASVERATAQVKSTRAITEEVAAGLLGEAPAEEAPAEEAPAEEAPAEEAPAEEAPAEEAPAEEAPAEEAPAEEAPAEEAPAEEAPAEEAPAEEAPAEEAPAEEAPAEEHPAEDTVAAVAEGLLGEAPAEPTQEEAADENAKEEALSEALEKEETDHAEEAPAADDEAPADEEPAE